MLDFANQTMTQDDPSMDHIEDIANDVYLVQLSLPRMKYFFNINA